AGMMKQANIGARSRVFIYTAGDERIAIYDTSFNWTWEARGLDGKVLRMFASTNDTSAGLTGTLSRKWLKGYVLREELLLASENSTAAGRATFHYHLDHLGTARLVTDGAGAKKATHTYYPFGEELYSTTPGESPEEQMKFTGHERDITGGADALDYMHARYYSPVQGRFAAVDSALDLQVAPHNPQIWNR